MLYSTSEMRAVKLLIFILAAYTAHAQDSTKSKLQGKNFSMSGSVSAQLGAYYVNGIPKRQQTFIWQLSGEVTFKFRDIIELPFSFVVGESHRKFNQPFDQFGLSPKYKWLTFHGGWRNIAWSQYSVAGKNMLCVGVEANPKYFRSGILFGRINRQTNLSPTDTSKVDSLLALTYTPSYKRLGLAIKVGAGTENNYVDFIYFRAWDKFKNDSLFTLNEAGAKTFFTPSENAAFSIVTSNKIGKYVTLKAEYALSTTNVDRTLPKNDSLPEGYAKIAKILLKPNTSAISGHAANFNGTFSKEMYTTNVMMELVTQNYNSFGAYYFQTNSYKVGASQNIPLGKTKNANLNFNLQYLNDNLNKKKAFTNNRIITGLGYNFNQAKFGITAQYTIAYSKQKIQNDSILGTPAEALKLNQANHTFVIVPRFTIIKGSKVHTILVTETINALTDFNGNTKTMSKFFNNVANLSYIGVLAEKNLTIQSSFFTSYIKNFSMSLVSYGISAGTTAQFLKNKMSLIDIISTSISKQNVVVNGQLGLSYQPERHHMLSFTNNLLWNSSSISGAPSFVEFRTLLSYTYSFF